MKALLPRLAPNEKLGDYNTMAKARKWLGGISDEEMEKEYKDLQKDYSEAFLRRQGPPLF